MNRVSILNPYRENDYYGTRPMPLAARVFVDATFPTTTMAKMARF